MKNDPVRILNSSAPALVIKYCHPEWSHYSCPHESGHYTESSHGRRIYCPGGPKPEKPIDVSPAQDGGTNWYAGEKWGWVAKGTLVSLDNSHVRKTVNDGQVGGDHYKVMAISPLEYILANKLPFVEGSIIKYVSRFPLKGGVEDLKKARHYLDILIEREENG